MFCLCITVHQDEGQEMPYISHLDHLENQSSGSSMAMGQFARYGFVRARRRNGKTFHVSCCSRVEQFWSSYSFSKQPHTIFEEEEDDKERNNPTQFHLLACVLTTPRSKIQSSKFKLLFQSLHSILVSFSELPYTPFLLAMPSKNDQVTWFLQQ